MSSMIMMRRKLRKIISIVFCAAIFLMYCILQPKNNSRAAIFRSANNHTTAHSALPREHLLPLDKKENAAPSSESISVPGTLFLLIHCYFLTTLFRRLFDFIEDFFNKSWYERDISHIVEFLKWNFGDRFFKHCATVFLGGYVVLFISYCLGYNSICIDEYISFIVFSLLVASIFALWETCKCQVWYSNVTMNHVLRNQPCPATLWATAACRAYFIHVTENIQERITAFEREHNVHIAVRKLLLVLPRSCDVRGLLDRHPNVEYCDNLPTVVTDHGGSVNRCFKNPVYKIKAEDGQPLYHVAMESSSSLLPLYTLRKKMSENLFDFQFSAYVKVVEEKMCDSACVILVYDDVNSRISFSDFVIQNIKRLLIEEKESFQIYRD